GRFLRRVRVDELPQLFHILLGDMSFVGPRPLLQKDVPPGGQARQLIKPGITGWAQVNGGHALSPRDKMMLDLWYIRNASLLLDMEILLKTIPVAIRGDRVNLDALNTARAERRENS
ncbi:sugar transferase, partial [bacterium AH-315-P15]|nr:sugar transferase [bacterium AH-315-P15]